MTGLATVVLEPNRFEQQPQPLVTVRPMATNMAMKILIMIVFLCLGEWSRIRISRLEGRLVSGVSNPFQAV